MSFFSKAQFFSVFITFFRLLNMFWYMKIETRLTLTLNHFSKLINFYQKMKCTTITAKMCAILKQRQRQRQRSMENTISKIDQFSNKFNFWYQFILFWNHLFSLNVELTKKYHLLEFSSFLRDPTILNWWAFIYKNFIKRKFCILYI